MNSQYQEMQMRLLQQQMQAQLQRQPQQGGQRMSQQNQMMNSGSFGNLPQGMGQVQQTSQFSNQQWMDPTQQQLLAGSQSNSQRNSFSGMNSAQAAMMLQQQGNQSSMGMSGSNNPLYWNTLQGNQKGGSSGIDSTGLGSNLAGLGGMNMGGSNSQQLNGMVDSQMQALLQQQSMGNSQSSQMRGIGSQQHLSGGKSDLTNAMSMMNQQQMHQISQLQKMQGGSSSAALGRTDVQGQVNAGNSPAQLLLQQQSVIADLKRRLQAQQTGGGGGSFAGSNNGNVGSSSNLLGTGMNDQRSSSSSIQQQQAQLLEMQKRGSANSLMIQQAMASGMIQDPNSRGSATSASMMQAANQVGGGVSNQRQQRNSFSSTEPISISSLMGQGQNTIDMGSMGRRGSNTSLLGVFDQANGNANNANALLQQQAQLQQMTSGGNMVGLAGMAGSSTGRSGSVNDQIFAQQQMLNISGIGSMGNDMQQAQQLVMGQSSSRNSMIVGSGTQGLSSNQLMTGFSDPTLHSLSGSVGADLGGSNSDKSMAPGSSSNKRRRSGTTSVKKASPATSPAPTSTGGQSFLDGTFNGGWQSNEDIPDRRRVIYSICKVIEQMRPDSSKMSQRLPFMAKRLEENLYRSAQTKEEYLDPSTLKRRLQLIAHRLEVHCSSEGSKKESSKRNDSVAERNGDPLPVNGLGDSSIGMSTGFNADNDPTNQQQQLGLLEQVNQFKQLQQMQQMQRLQQLQKLQQQQQQQQQQQFGSSAGNNLESLLTQQQLKDEILLRQQNNQAPGQQNNMTAASVTSGIVQDGSVTTSDVYSMTQQEQKMLQLQSLSTHSSQSKSSQGILKTSSSKYDPQKRKVVKQQQQRLLLLRHASKCGEGSACKVKFCGQMISLWKHMKKCRDKDCKTAHCLSSRCVLNHYRICKSKNKTSTCEVCGPVMRQIKDNHPPDDDESTTNDDTVTQGGLPRQDVPGQQPSQFEREGNNSSNLVRGGGDSQRIEDLQAAQLKIQQKQALLNQVQNQQVQLFEQQTQLEHQQQHVAPQTQKGQHLQQQQLLLQQLLIQFQQQEMLLRQEIMQLSHANQGSGSVQNLHDANDIPPNLQGTHPAQGSQDLFGSQPMLGVLDLQVVGSQQLTSLSEAMGTDLGDLGEGTPEQALNKPDAPGSRGTGVLHLPLQRQGSSNSMSAKGTVPSVVRRGSMGKRLSALESRISRNSDNVSTRHVGIEATIGISHSFDADASSYRSSDQVATFDNLHDHAFRPDNAPGSDLPAVPGEVQSEGKHGRVLEQGDADFTTSLIPSMSKSDIEEHLHSLEHAINSKPRAVSQKMLPVVRRLIHDPLSWVFRDAVDIELLGIEDYYDVVKNPMHLTLVEQNLENGVYQDMKAAEDDIRLVFENSILYNGADSEVGEMATNMIQRFEKELQGLSGTSNNLDRWSESGDTCTLCNEQRLLFEPTSLYCVGACGMQKISRNSFYYTSGPKSRTNNWCTYCYDLLENDVPIVLDGGAQVMKSDLKKLKNDSIPEEAWVKCDSCDCWVHQICALFSGKKNSVAASFFCPKCQLVKLNSGDTKHPDEPMKTAKDLPHCKMSVAVEKGLEAHLVKEYKCRAEKLGVSLQEVEKAEGLCVRVVSNVQKTHVVRDEMFKRYSKSGCPPSFPVRSKCIALFQKISGVDVILFTMFVFEYDHDCPAPNRRRVYISCLDSIKYLEPACYRTAAYQAIIVEYLRYVKDRGFHTAHIWSCPPTPGDDGIFHCHPSKQVVPTDAWLRSWYLEVLEKAKAEGVVLEVRTLHDEYFRNNGAESTTGQASEPTCLPYFEGDYIPGEIEKIIGELAAEDEAKNKNREDLPSVSTSNKGGSKKGTRSNPGELINVGPDKIMLRLGLAMANMEQNFMVVYLRNRAFAASVEKGECVSQWTEDNDDRPSTKRIRIGGKNSGMMITPGQAATQVEAAQTTYVESDDLGDHVSHEVTDANKAADDDANSLCSASIGGSFARARELDEDPMNTFNESSTTVGEDANPITLHDCDPDVLGNSGEKPFDGLANPSEVDKADSTLTGQDAHAVGESQHPIKLSNKRGFDEIKPAIAAYAAANVDTKLIGDTKDEDEPHENDMFESRQQFLNYCRANHFQFDELRRAKHSTMMVLYNLHHPIAPPVDGINVTMNRRRQQQQYIDDRRRLSQNQLYRDGSVQD